MLVSLQNKLFMALRISNCLIFINILTRNNIRMLFCIKCIPLTPSSPPPLKKEKLFFKKNACLCIVLTMDWWTMKPSVITQYTHIYRSPTGYRGNSWSPSQAKWWTQQKNSKEYCRLMVVSLKFDVPVIKRDNISKTPIWFN